MSRYEPDDDERREAFEARRTRRNRSCQCSGGEEMPGRCPGPANCPMVDHSEDDE